MLPSHNAYLKNLHLEMVFLTHKGKNRTVNPVVVQEDYKLP